jgi:hypothetical protein
MTTDVIFQIRLLRWLRIEFWNVTYFDKIRP